MAETEVIYNYSYTGEWYEVGEPFGLVKASIQYALKHPETAEGFKKYLKEDIIPQLK